MQKNVPEEGQGEGERKEREREREREAEGEGRKGAHTSCSIQHLHLVGEL